jgi:uncharacterized protein DUF6789
MTTTLRWQGLPMALKWVGVVSASVSGAAILIHALGWLPMYFLIEVLAVPSLLGLLLVGVAARRVHADVVLNRLIVGSWAGLLATLAYDVVRWLLLQVGVINFDPYLTHPIFGMLITGQPETSTTAIVVGWLYHFWNGFTFGVMYTLVAGASHWGYAVLWALLLEVAWLTALPSVLSFNLNTRLIAMSLIGHIAYGLVLGPSAQRFIRE